VSARLDAVVPVEDIYVISVRFVAYGTTYTAQKADDLQPFVITPFFGNSVSLLTDYEFYTSPTSSFSGIDSVDYPTFLAEVAALANGGYYRIVYTGALAE
jgi:hypothetical protein